MAEIFYFSTIGEKGALEVWATKNVIKDKRTGSVDIFCCTFEKIKKMLKLKTWDPKKHIIECF